MKDHSQETLRNFNSLKQYLRHSFQVSIIPSTPNSSRVHSFAFVLTLEELVKLDFGRSRKSTFQIEKAIEKRVQTRWTLFLGKFDDKVPKIFTNVEVFDDSNIPLKT